MANAKSYMTPEKLQYIRDHPDTPSRDIIRSLSITRDMLRRARKGWYKMG